MWPKKPQNSGFCEFSIPTLKTIDGNGFIGALAKGIIIPKKQYSFTLHHHRGIEILVAIDYTSCTMYKHIFQDTQNDLTRNEFYMITSMLYK